MPRVSFIARYVPQYREGFLRGARAQLAEAGVTLRVIHGQPTAAERAKGDAVSLDWAERVDNAIVPLGRREVYWQPIMRRVWDDDLVVVEQGSRLLVNYPLIFAQRWGGPAIAFWGHGRHFAAHEVTAVGEAAKTILARRPHWWFAYTERSARVVEELGYPRERITVVQNAVDTRGLREMREALTEGELAALRTRLHLGDGRVGVYCGALYREKRLAFLVQACDLVRSVLPTFQVVVIGGGEDEQVLRAAAATRPWLHYVGPKFGREKVAHLALGDVFLMPAFVGLAVLDAFALELPLVTAADASQGHEIEYLQDGRNGILVASADDSQAYASAVVSVLSEPRLLERLRRGCRESAQRYTVEAMVERFCDGVVASLQAPPLSARR